MSVSRSKSSRNGRARQPRAVAFYNLDGVVTGLKPTHAILFILANIGVVHQRVMSLVSFAARFPRSYLIDDPKELNARLYESLKGISSDRLVELGMEYCDRILIKRLRPAALELIEANRSLELEPVIVSECPETVVITICEHLGIDHFAANRPVIARGIATGRLANPSIVAEEKADWCVDYAQQNGIDLRACWAYASSIADLPMLAAVGHPVVVNPDRKLRAAAMVRQWPIMNFDKSVANEPEDFSGADIIEFSRRPADGAS